MKKNNITIKGVALGLGIGLILGLIISVLVAGAFNGAFRSIPKPDIREGEFDFALTYEVDGEEKKIEGTYVCKFDGVTKALDGVCRDWTGYIKDHDNFTDYEIKTTDKGVIMVNLDISPEFFMSDPNYKLSENTDDPKPEPYLYIKSGDPANEAFFDYTDDNVKIISFEYDQPIENTYR